MVEAIGGAAGLSFVKKDAILGAWLNGWFRRRGFYWLALLVKLCKHRSSEVMVEQRVTSSQAHS